MDKNDLEIFPANWSIYVYTSAMSQLQQQRHRQHEISDVKIQIFGDKAASTLMSLDTTSATSGTTAFYEPGKCDKFEKNLPPNIGRPLRLKVSHHSKSSPDAVWHLEKIVLENKKTSERFAFDCRCDLACKKEFEFSTTKLKPRTDGNDDEK